MPLISTIEAGAAEDGDTVSDGIPDGSFDSVGLSEEQLIIMAVVTAITKSSMYRNF